MSSTVPPFRANTKSKHICSCGKLYDTWRDTVECYSAHGGYSNG